jgi:hypothetical protein
VPIDPNNEARDLVMSVFGGMSRGEHNRVKIRVRAALDAGENPATVVASWIAEAKAEKAFYALVMRRPKPRPRMTQQELKSISPIGSLGRLLPPRPGVGPAWRLLLLSVSSAGLPDRVPVPAGARCG